MRATHVKKKVFVPGVVVLEEKHGTAYYNAPDEETLHKVALTILKGRHKAGYWYHKPEAPKKPDYTDPTEIAGLRGDLKKRAEERLTRYKGELAQYEDEKLRFEDIQKAVRENDGALAWRILRERSDYEYEKVTLESFSTTYGS